MSRCKSEITRNIFCQLLNFEDQSCSCHWRFILKGGIVGAHYFDNITDNLSPSLHEHHIREMCQRTILEAPFVVCRLLGREGLCVLHLIWIFWIRRIKPTVISVFRSSLQKASISKEGTSLLVKDLPCCSECARPYLK